MGVLHNAGQLAGHALNALPGYSTLGANITNPNVNYKGAYNPPTPENNYFTPPSQPGSQQAATNDGTQQNTGTGTYAGDGGAGAAQTAQEKAMALFGIDNGLSSANDSLSRLDSQAQTGYGNIDRQYQDAYGRLDATHQLGNAQYTQNRNAQLNEYQSNRNQVADKARNWLDAARQTLGANGAGGGSAARYGVPLQAQNMAAQGNATAQATNNKNIIALDQSKQKNEDAFGNSVADIQTQRTQGRQDYQSQIETQRAQLLNTIAQLTGQKTIANGGDYKGALAASTPYTSQLPAIMAKIDSLAATPEVKAQQFTLDAPSLAGYNWARPADSPVAQQDPTLAQPGYVPTYGQDGQDQQQNPVYNLFGLDPNQRQYA